MSRGKYSPTLNSRNTKDVVYMYNSLGQMPPVTWSPEAYNEAVHFANYDIEGYDSYGYSAYVCDNYVGIGMGVDRAGNTEMDYLSMSDDEFDYFL